MNKRRRYKAKMRRKLEKGSLFFNKFPPGYLALLRGRYKNLIWSKNQL